MSNKFFPIMVYALCFNTIPAALMAVPCDDFVDSCQNISGLEVNKPDDFYPFTDAARGAFCAKVIDATKDLNSNELDRDGVYNECNNLVNSNKELARAASETKACKNVVEGMNTKFNGKVCTK